MYQKLKMTFLLHRQHPNGAGALHGYERARPAVERIDRSALFCSHGWVGMRVCQLCAKKCVLCACVGTHLASLLPDRPSRVQDAHEADGALLPAVPVIASVRSMAECATQGRSPCRHEDESTRGRLPVHQLTIKIKLTSKAPQGHARMCTRVLEYNYNILKST